MHLLVLLALPLSLEDGPGHEERSQLHLLFYFRESLLQFMLYIISYSNYLHLGFFDYLNQYAVHIKFLLYTQEFLSLL